MKRKIDHIVYTVFDLEKAVAHFEQTFGVCPILGGYHNNFGTKNALINLDNAMYLELLAADHTNTKIPRPRWMGVDALTENQITRWCLKSDNLERDSQILTGFCSDMGRISGGSRNTTGGSVLKWELILPLPLPEVEIVPFSIDWSQSKTHPHDTLPDMGCRLIELYGMHPNPDQFREIFEALELDLRVQKADKAALRAILKCPKGIVEI